MEDSIDNPLEKLPAMALINIQILSFVLQLIHSLNFHQGCPVGNDDNGRRSVAVAAAAASASSFPPEPERR
jgi:hypothetical protein